MRWRRRRKAKLGLEKEEWNGKQVSRIGSWRRHCGARRRYCRESCAAIRNLGEVGLIWKLRICALGGRDEGEQEDGRKGKGEQRGQYFYFLLTKALIGCSLLSKLVWYLRYQILKPYIFPIFCMCNCILRVTNPFFSWCQQS